MIDEPIDAVISVGVPLKVPDLKFTTTKLPHAEIPPCSIILHLIQSTTDV